MYSEYVNMCTPTPPFASVNWNEKRCARNLHGTRAKSARAALHRIFEVSLLNGAFAYVSILTILIGFDPHIQKALNHVVSAQQLQVDKSIIPFGVALVLHCEQSWVSLKTQVTFSDHVFFSIKS